MNASQNGTNPSGQQVTNSDQDQVFPGQVHVRISDSGGRSYLVGVLNIQPGVGMHEIDSMLGRIHQYSGSHFIGHTRIQTTRQPYTPDALAQENADLRAVLADRDDQLHKLLAKKPAKKSATVKPAKKPAKPVKKASKKAAR